MTEPPRGNFDTRHYQGLIWRWKWLLLAIVVLIPVAVYFISSRNAKVYEASTTLLVQGTTITTSQSSSPIAVSTSSAPDVARLIETPVVANLAAKKLGEPASAGRSLLPSVNAAVENTNAEAGSQNNFLTITAQAGTPAGAVDLAQAFADAVSAKRAQDASEAIDTAIENLSADAAAAEDKLTKQTMLTQISQLQSIRPTLSSRTQVVDPPVPPTEAIAPKPLRNAFLGFIFAILIALGMLPLLDRLDRRLRSDDEIEPLVGAPLLAMIPESAFPGHPPSPMVRESFQTLRAGLTSYNVDLSLTSIAVVSAVNGEGKTTVATNLAVALARDNRDVILVDGDLRRPQAGARFTIKSNVGLGAVLLGESSLAETLVEMKNLGGGRLRVLPAGIPPRNPSVLLGSQRMSDLLSELTEIADIVVIDTPPLLVVGDVIPLLKRLSGAVYVVRVDQTTRDAVTRSRKVISSAGGTIIGAVATATKAGGLYGYGIGAYAVPEAQAVAQNGASNDASRFRRLVGRARSK